MKAISVELNRRTHFLEAALCSQTWCHGMSGCMRTSHMHTGTLSALTLLFVCICELAFSLFARSFLHVSLSVNVSPRVCVRT